MSKKKIRALYALAMLMFFGASLGIFIIASNEQSVVSSGSPDPATLSIQDLIAHGPGSNKNIELTGFFIGKQYVFTTKLVQFKDVYLPVFPAGQAEAGSNLRVLVWIRNDGNSNQPLVENRNDLDQSVAAFNRQPKPVTGVLRNPPNDVRKLTLEAYPGTNTQSLQVLWARRFPDQTSVTLLWCLTVLCLAAGVVFGVAFKRQSRHLSAG